jgi:4a-hydroxytetrahydrobiopterin dehydratase
MNTCKLDDLARRKCVPCHGGIAPLKGAELKQYLQALGGDWKAVKNHHLEKEFKFKDFKSALAFTNKIGALAERQGHHPDLYLAWGKVRVTIWTHAVDGVTESDFVLAAKIESLKRS